MNPQYPCKICKNEVKNKDPSIYRDICNMWIHNEFINMSPKTFEKLQNDDASACYCPICVRSLPFSNLRWLVGLGKLRSSKKIEIFQIGLLLPVVQWKKSFYHGQKKQHFFLIFTMELFSTALSYLTAQPTLNFTWASLYF